MQPPSLFDEKNLPRRSIYEFRFPMSPYSRGWFINLTLGKVVETTPSQQFYSSQLPSMKSLHTHGDAWMSKLTHKTERSSRFQSKQQWENDNFASSPKTPRFIPQRRSRQQDYQAATQQRVTSNYMWLVVYEPQINIHIMNVWVPKERN